MSLTKFLLIGIHIMLAWLVYQFPFFAKVYGTGWIVLVFAVNITVMESGWNIFLLSNAVPVRRLRALFFSQSNNCLTDNSFVVCCSDFAFMKTEKICGDE